ncbi:unnamed protein product, partial [Nesidiocoris tenuis]
MRFIEKESGRIRKGDVGGGAEWRERCARWLWWRKHFEVHRSDGIMQNTPRSLMSELNCRAVSSSACGGNSSFSSFLAGSDTLSRATGLP